MMKIDIRLCVKQNGCEGNVRDIIRAYCKNYKVRTSKFASSRLSKTQMRVLITEVNDISGLREFIDKYMDPIIEECKNSGVEFTDKIYGHEFPITVDSRESKAWGEPA